MEITKLKVVEDSTTVEFVAMNLQTPQSSQLEECPDKRRPKFADAIAAVQDDARDIIGLGKKVMERWTFTQVSVSKNSNGHRGFIFHGKLRTNAGDVALQTPLMRERVDGEGGENTLSDLVMKRVKVLLQEAVEYAQGARQPQTELPMGQAAAGGGAAN